MRRPRVTLLVAALVALASALPAHAGPPRAIIRFLGSNPVGPIASVHDHDVTRPERGACLSWGPVGSRWLELDLLGRVVGTVAVERREHYDVSGCDELSMRRVSGTGGAGVYVDAAAPYRAARVVTWRPERDASAALEQLARARQEEIRDLIPATHRPFEERVFYFEWQASAERYAVVGGRSLLVLSFRDGRWSLLHEERPKDLRAQDGAYSAVLVTDMNADGAPEIVVHTQEGLGEWYANFTLSRGTSGAWRKVDAGIFGSTD